MTREHLSSSASSSSADLQSVLNASPSHSHSHSHSLSQRSSSSEPELPLLMTTVTGKNPSPLNPNYAPPPPPSASLNPPPHSHSHSHPIPRLPSDSSASSSTGGNRGSMILYKLAGPNDNIDFSPSSSPSPYPLTPPETRRFSRFSHHSSISGSGSVSSSTFLVPTPYSDDSKYPATPSRSGGGFIPYPYDPLLVDGGKGGEEWEDDEEDGDYGDRLGDPKQSGGGGSSTSKGGKKPSSPSSRTNKSSSSSSFGMNVRGILNVGMVVLVLTALILLFTLLPIVTFLRRHHIVQLITGNSQINSTGQFPDLPNLPSLIDKATPQEALTRTGFDGKQYNLVFSDEFEIPNRTFWPGDDPYWEAVDLWYWATSDLEWYDPGQVRTRDGKLVITLEQTPSHGLQFKSGMLQSWNKFCFTRGYIELSLSLPGRNSDAQGYWPGAWIMGNLGRPGYGASTDGMWPYSYDSCDLGTFPNQTIRDPNTGAPLGPAAALHTDSGRSKYNFELSWLSGQRLSACGCQSDFEAGNHPGPRGDMGRGAPEIDVLEAQKNKLGEGGKVSQSAQFAPFNMDYQANYEGLEIFNESLTARNPYNGSAVQQAITCLTTLPERIFAGTGREFATFGFEYWSNPSNRGEGYIQWQSDGEETFRMDASVVGPDVAGGSGVSERLVSEEPMSIILNLAISQSFQTVDLTTLDFPAEFLIDYVRVYQREGERNVGCDPEERPTGRYIEEHLVAYSNPNITNWKDTGFGKPKNSMLDGAC